VGRADRTSAGQESSATRNAAQVLCFHHNDATTFARGDKRDFQPVDDLVRRVFDEGIGVSDAALFVLSPVSVDRRCEQPGVHPLHDLRHTFATPALVARVPIRAPLKCLGTKA
jgi:hypothetical protein